MAEHSSDADTWHLRDARAHFSGPVDKAVTRGPQVVTRHGKPAVVVVSAREWEHRNRRRGNLVEFFARPPPAARRGGSGDRTHPGRAARRRAANYLLDPWQPRESRA